APARDGQALCVWPVQPAGPRREGKSNRCDLHALTLQFFLPLADRQARGSFGFLLSPPSTFMCFSRRVPRGPVFLLAVNRPLLRRLRELSSHHTQNHCLLS